MRLSLLPNADPDNSVHQQALPGVFNLGKACSHPGGRNEIPLFHELEV